eukprot:125482_1
MAKYWTCGYCTLENENSNSLCELCQKKRPDTGIKPATDTDNKEDTTPITKDNNNNDNNNDNDDNKDDNKWQCERCALFNKLSDNTCTTCEQQKPSPNKNKNNNEWKCSICTFSNPSNTLKCSMCDTFNPNLENINNNINKKIKTTYVWEWKGGSKWYEYCDNISNQIQTSYNNGIIKIDLDLSHSKYIIDLSKLQQINTETQKTRKIRCVKYEQSIQNNTQNDIQMTDINNNNNDEIHNDNNNTNDNNNINNKDTNNNNTKQL